MVVCLRWLYHHMLLGLYCPGKAEFWVFYYCVVLWCVQIIEYILVLWSYSCVCTSRYPIIIIMQIYQEVLKLQNACKIYSVSSVSKIKPILLNIFHAIYTIYRVVHIQLTHFFNDDCESTCTQSYYHHQSEVWPICHCLGLGHETMVCTVCLSIFLWNGR